MSQRPLNLKILELGNYIAPAYAGMILAEQGHTVEKWTNGRDPILSLKRGRELWDWINEGKRINRFPFSDVLESADHYDVIIDNMTPSALQKYGIDPEFIARRSSVRWVSLRSEVGQRSFDAIAQARSWMEYTDWIPFYIGDTAAGLWLAFKAVASSEPGHYVLGQASVLQKLVEGELMLSPVREKHKTPWDADQYGANQSGGVSVLYKGELISETVKDTGWKLDHLYHRNGRITV